MTTETEALAAVADLQEARKELRDRTQEMVLAMKAEGRTRDFAEGYFVGVSLRLPDHIVQYARRVFAEIWPPEHTAE